MSNTLGVFERIDMEAATIAFQTNKQLVNKLGALFSEMRNNPTGAELIADRFSAIVYDELGLSISFNLSKSKEIGAAIEVPEITKNHPLLRWIGKYANNREAIRVAKSASDLESTIDFKNVKITGVLSEIRMNAYFTAGAIENLTAEELTGLACHELGHTWYAMAFLGLNTAFSMSMIALGEDLARFKGAKGATETIRVKLIDGFSKNANIKLDANKIGNLSPEESIVFIRDAYQEKWRNTHAVDGFDQREFERLADQFAVRMGAGYATATALSKLWKSQGEYIRFPTITKILVALAWIFVILFAKIGGLILIYAIYSANSVLYNPVYDANQNRLEHIWREMLQGLKRSTEPVTTRREIIQQIEDIRKMSENYEEEMDYWSRMWFAITRDNKRGSYIVEQQEQERMSRNTLFLAAAKLNTV